MGTNGTEQSAFEVALSPFEESFITAQREGETAGESSAVPCQPITEFRYQLISLVYIKSTSTCRERSETHHEGSRLTYHFDRR